MKAAKVIAYVLVTLAVIAVVALAGWFVYSFVRNGQKSFYVSYGETKISAGTSELELPKNTTVFFSGRTIAGMGEESTLVENYTVKVVPTQKLVTAVKYRVGEEKETYLSGDADFSKAFKVTKKGATFSLIVPVELELKAAIAEAVEKEITTVSGTPAEEGSYFELVIEYAAENAKIVIPLTVALR